MTERLVIIGNGMAPGWMLEHLLDAAPGRYAVTIFNAEPRVNYDRITLSPVLSGEKTYDQIIIHGDGWYVENGITLYKSHKITSIDRVGKTVTSDRGATEPMERQLDAAVGYLLQRALEDRGIEVICKGNTKAILGSEKVEGVELAALRLLAEIRAGRSLVRAGLGPP